jgi:hypothetical protein
MVQRSRDILPQRLDHADMMPAKSVAVAAAAIGGG